MACCSISLLPPTPPHLCTSGGREDLACAGPPARTFAVRAVGLAPPQPGARAICECGGARARPHTPRDASVPSVPCAPRVCWRAGLRRVWRFGMCGMSSSSTQFRPVRASSGQFGRVCGGLWRVPGSVCECSRVPRVRHSSCRVIQVFFKFSLRTRVDRSGCEIWLDPLWTQRYRGRRILPKNSLKELRKRPRGVLSFFWRNCRPPHNHGDWCVA